MSDKFQIPKVIRDAVHNALASYPVAANTSHAAEIACEAFAKALAEHPVIPTHEQAIALCEVFEDKGGSRKPDYCDSIRAVAIEFQRCMFVAPEPEVPEGIKDMLLDARSPDSEHCFFKPSVYNERITEAYRRGKESREQ